MDRGDQVPGAQDEEGEEKGSKRVSIDAGSPDAVAASQGDESDLILPNLNMPAENDRNLESS